MFIYEIVGYSFIQSKSLYVLHLMYSREGTNGHAVETCFVHDKSVEGVVNVGNLCKVYRDNRGYCQGIEII